MRGKQYGAVIHAHRATTPILIIVLSVALHTTAKAEAAADTPPPATGRHWAISIWGVSYHTNRSTDFEKANWGLGLRYSARPRWHWLGDDVDNRVFVEADALRNSNRGIVLPLSAGLEYRIARVAHKCGLFAVGAFTVAYYENPITETTQIKYGPVPGVAIGCGHVKLNTTAVLSASRVPLAALVGSITILF